MSIYLPPRSSDVTHLPTECPQKQENTHLGPNPYFLLVENNHRSDRLVQPSYYTIIPAVPYLLWRLNYVVKCAHFSEVRPACVCCHAESLRGEMMTHTPCATESPNKRSPAAAQSKICNINHLISQTRITPAGSAGQSEFEARALSDEWFISPHLSLKIQCPKAELWGTSNTDRDVKGGEKHRHKAVMNLWKNLFREKHVEGKKNGLQRFIFFLWEGIDGSLQTLFQLKWQFNFVTVFSLCLSLCVFSPSLSHFWVNLF